MSNLRSATGRLAQVEHVQYELTQMVGAAIRVASTTDPITKNALLESALLHVRSLIDFLTDSGQPQDIRASTFGSTWKIDTVTHNALRGRKKLLDQHLAHITEARAQDGKQQWPYLNVVSEIVDLMGKYHAGLPAGSPAESSIGATLQHINQQAPLPPLPPPGGTMSTLRSEGHYDPDGLDRPPATPMGAPADAGHLVGRWASASEARQAVDRHHERHGVEG